MTKHIKLNYNQQVEICKKYQDGISSVKIAKQFNTSSITIIKYLRKNNITIRKSGTKKFDYDLLVSDYLSGLSINEVAIKNLTSIGTVSRALKIKNISVRPPLSGKDHPLWNGGSYKDKDEYILSSIKNKRVHRELIENLFNKKLESWECVHHINGNKSDNNIANLVVMPIREHTRFHNFLYFRGLEISRNNLELYARKQDDFYYRFTKEDFEKYSNFEKIKKYPKKKMKCKEKYCNNERYGKKDICSKHYQRKRAKEKGYWISGGGRKANCKF